MSQQKAAEIGKTWYQGKRVPLYVVVAGSLAGKPAQAYYLYYFHSIEPRTY